MSRYEWWTCPVVGDGLELDPKRPDTSEIPNLIAWVAEAGAMAASQEMLILAEVEDV